MQLAIVVGQVVSTMKYSSLAAERLLVVDLIDLDGKPAGVHHVAADAIGAGNGEWVLVVSGSSARKTGADDAPIDLCIVGIVDEVALMGKVVYHK